MDFLWDKITEWLKEMLIGGIVSNLSGMFDATNQKVAEISGQVGLSPQAWNGSIFSMIQNLSETVIVPHRRRNSRLCDDAGTDPAHYRQK